MIYLLKDIKANKLYFFILTFSLTIFTLATSLSTSSYLDYYYKDLGNLVNNTKYIYEMKIDNIKNSDLEALSNYSKNNYDYINIVNIVLEGELSKVYVLNYKGFNNTLSEGNKFDSNTSNVIVSDDSYSIGDSIQINQQKNTVVGKVDSENFHPNMKYYFINYDSERDKLNEAIPTTEGELSLLICSNKKIKNEIETLKNLLLEKNKKININISNKKYTFFKSCFVPNTYFYSRVIYPLKVVLISLINLILFISYFNNIKKKEIYLRKVLGASNFKIVYSEFIKLLICTVISCIISFIIQYTLDLYEIKSDVIPMEIFKGNLLFFPLATLILIILILIYIYPITNKSDINGILKE